MLAQSTSSVTQLIVPGKGNNKIVVRCKDGQELSQCIDGVQGLSAKEKGQLKLELPKLQTGLKDELAKAMAKAQADKNACFALRVYAYPKGFPEKNGKAQAKVSECTSAANVKEKTLEMHAKTLKATPQH
ncbi:MAG: hypothetical protein ACP5M4_11275 [Acidobacteriaceae bacterium]